MIALFLSIAMAACPTMYGKQNPDSSWSFSEVQESGMIEADTDNQCRTWASAYVLQNGKWKIDAALKAAAKASEDQDKIDSKLITKKALKALEDRVSALEAKVP